MGQKLKGYLRLMRPANVVTAVSDILAGVCIAGYFALTGNINFSVMPVFWLCLSTACLYAGGVVLNDVLDARLDAVERPERPIPSGLIKKRNAALFGALLLLSGMLAAGLVQAVFFSISFYIAVGIAAASVLYDGWGKHHGWLGPLNMGLCRGLNLALGISVVAPILSAVWYVCFVPVVYIAAVTAISRGEVHGGQKRVLYFAALLYGAVLFCIAGIAYKNNHLLPALPFILLFSIQILQPLFQAIHDPVGPKIGKAVKAGVLALILMNAAWAAAFGFWYVGLGMLLLLPLSMRLARWFAVT